METQLPPVVTNPPQPTRLQATPDLKGNQHPHPYNLLGYELLKA